MPIISIIYGLRVGIYYNMVLLLNEMMDNCPKRLGPFSGMDCPP